MYMLARIGFWAFASQLFVTDSSALQYVNYTSYKYKIQFLYPTNWVQGEKIAPNDIGADISVTAQSYAEPGMLLIVHGNMIGLESDLMTEIGKVENILGDFFRYELALPVSHITIGGQEAATFIYSVPDKRYDRELEPIHQIWMIHVGDMDYYLILFTAPRYSFSNPENTEIRNQFIKSMRFIG